MKRTPVAQRDLPGYTKNEEMLNTVTHIIGAAFAFLALNMCIIIPLINNNPWALAGGAIYGVSMIFLYTMSSVYHGLESEYPKKICQVIDHCAVYAMIVGTYMPILFTGVRSVNINLFRIMIAVIFASTAIGVTFTAIDVNKYKPLTIITYLAIGWCFLAIVKPLRNIYPIEFVLWIISGGISITIGTVLYLMGRKHRYFHGIFHIFVLIGSMLAFVGIFKYCIMG